MTVHYSCATGSRYNIPFHIVRLKPLGAAAVLIGTGMISHMASAQLTDNPEEIIVTSSRIPIPLRQTGTSVSVLNQFEIESHGNPALADVLRQMPATGSSSNGGIGKPTTVRIRGEEGFRTLTILDGIRLQDPSAPQITTSFENLVSSDIGRIEVLRGPQGLAYGADAGGVINMNSRSSEQGFAVNADAQTGRYGTNQLTGNIAGQGDRLDYFLSVTDFQTDGFNTRDSDTSLMDDDGYENTSLHTRVGFNLTDRLLAEVVYRNVDGENQFDGCFSGGRVDDCSSEYELDAGRVALEYTGEAFNHSLAYSNTRTDRENFTAGAFSFGAAGELQRWEYIGAATALPGFDLVFGADQEEALNNGIGRDNRGYFLEYLSDFSDSLFFTAGLRHDDNDDSGSNTSYRLSGAYLTELDSGTLKFKGALGTGFRAPSPSEIAYNSGGFAFPPASDVMLLQEESQGWEMGLEFFTERLHLEAVYFDQVLENAIFFDLAGFSGYLQDVGSSHSRGLEVSADYAISEAWRVNGNYTYNDTERPDGSQRLRRPENLFNLGVLHARPGGRLNVNAFYRSQADSIDIGNRPLDNFGVVDVTATYRLNENFRIYARLENLLDEDYQEILDYNTSASAAFIGVKFSFSP